jgi:integrase
MGDQMKLTDKAVRALPAPTKGNVIAYDATVKGFGARVTAGGSRAFVLNYRRRSDGTERRYTIGAFPDWSVVAAREEAKRLKRDIDLGADPVGEHNAARAAPTVNDLADRFEAEHLPRLRPSSARDYKSVLTCHVRPALGRRKVAAVAFADVDTLHRDVTKRSGLYRANRVIAIASKMFALAIRWGMRTNNPCKGIERNTEQQRRRYLSGAETERLFKALAAYRDQDAADYFRLLLLTGARAGETLAMRWQDVDVEAGTWTKPASTTKTKLNHSVPLSAPARQLLAARSRTSEWVFPGRSGQHRSAGIKYSWARICEAAKISGLRVHDLRHSFASQLASAGIGLHVIGGLLGHSEPKTTFRYAHLVDDALRAATERAGAAFAASMGGGADVLSIKDRRR